MKKKWLTDDAHIDYNYWKLWYFGNALTLSLYSPSYIHSIHSYIAFRNACKNETWAFSNDKLLFGITKKQRFLIWVSRREGRIKSQNVVDTFYNICICHIQALTLFWVGFFNIGGKNQVLCLRLFDCF